MVGIRKTIRAPQHAANYNGRGHPIGTWTIVAAHSKYRDTYVPIPGLTDRYKYRTIKGVLKAIEETQPHFQSIELYGVPSSRVFYL